MCYCKTQVVRSQAWFYGGRNLNASIQMTTHRFPVPSAIIDLLVSFLPISDSLSSHDQLNLKLSPIQLSPYRTVIYFDHVKKRICQSQHRVCSTLLHMY
jgi:hypothetical protein